MEKYELEDQYDLIEYLKKRDHLEANKKARVLLKNLIYYVLKINRCLQYNSFIIYNFNNNKILIESGVNELTDLYDVTIEELIENKILIESEV